MRPAARRLFVKICGITDVADAKAAIEGGADAVGFIFWPTSPRFVSVDRAREIVAALPPEALKVGVFVNQTLEEVNAICDGAGLTDVQLHGDEACAFASGVRRPVIKATSLAGEDERLDEWPPETRWLVDAHDTDRRGGTGRTANWERAAVLATRHRVILAGGLSAANVVEAVTRVRPFGIDVSSGVELRPGVKDSEKLKQLFEAISGIVPADAGKKTDAE